MRASNIRIHEEYQVMMTEVGKVSHTGEEVLALKKLIQKCNVDQERLREQIQANKEKDEFLMGHRFAVPEEDFEIGMKVGWGGGHRSRWGPCWIGLGGGG